MERNWELCREILFKVEELHIPGEPWIQNFDLSSDWSETEISEHVYLLDQAGLIEAKDLSSSSKYSIIPIRLTWAGHEFTSKSRDQNNWKLALEFVLKRTGAASFDLIFQKLSDLAEGQLISGS